MPITSTYVALQEHLVRLVYKFFGPNIRFFWYSKPIMKLVIKGSLEFNCILITL